MNERINRMAVGIIYEELHGLLEQYAETECYNRAPTKAPESDGLAYVKRRMAEIWRTAAAWLSWTKVHTRKIVRILLEVEYFLRSCECPGVVRRWKEIDPALNYFDCAFELMEKSPEQYERIRMGLSNLRLSCYPDQKWVEQRKAYFEAARKRLEDGGQVYSEDKVFQDELLQALTLVFQVDFGDIWGQSLAG